MVVNKTINKLIETGFTEYEAKAYMALIAHHPATAYEVAKSSGIPTSKVYEVLSKLQEKKVIASVGEDKKHRFVPQDPEELIAARKDRLNTTLNELQSELTAIKPEQSLSYIWNIYEYSELIDKATRLIQGASQAILISAWHNELKYLEPFIKSKSKQGVNVSIVHFGETSVVSGQMFQHPIEDTLLAEKGGRHLVIIKDSAEALMGTVYSEEEVEGASSMNRGFVTMAEDYIKHDIYIMKIVRRFDKQLKKRFGDKYYKLRDVFHDQEVAS